MKFGRLMMLLILGIAAAASTAIEFRLGEWVFGLAFVWTGFRLLD